ncbi:unnamed protein product [Haemonchus placei]|uniref:CPR type cuticle protein n=1 Tax=Haemonchus placei TaxID=6290 RepID=A0A0N4WWQ5_HAEPC|nr:unnamed protein product [Haemonchus placei]
MNSFVVVALAVLACTVLSDKRYYSHGSGEFGEGHHGKNHGSSYNKGYTKGFEKKGYGEYGSHKYGGWKNYARGEERGSQYGSEYDRDHEHDEHHYEGHRKGYKYFTDGHNDHDQPNHDHDNGHGHGYVHEVNPSNQHGDHRGNHDHHAEPGMSSRNQHRGKDVKAWVGSITTQHFSIVPSIELLQAVETIAGINATKLVLDPMKLTNNVLDANVNKFKTSINICITYSFCY